MPGHTRSISRVLCFVLSKILLGREITTPSLLIGKQEENDGLQAQDVLSRGAAKDHG